MRLELSWKMKKCSCYIEEAELNEETNGQDDVTGENDTNGQDDTATLLYEGSSL